MAAASSKIDGTTLTKIFKVDEELLKEKFGLKPYLCYDPLKKDNLVFMSPTVCLQNLELQEGGWKARGGHLGIFWVGMCRPGLQIGTPF